jgi:hypothetical protein
MTVYEAIMRAADHIDLNPGCFNFQRGERPSHDHDKSCPLAWIGYFLDLPDDTKPDVRDLYANAVAKRLTGMFEIAPFFKLCSKEGGICDRNKAPKLMRAYAIKYHKPISREIPGCVLNIFNEVIAQPITVKPVDVPQL